jgi:hypothetical protein
LLTAGRYFSWIVLLGIPAICFGAVAAALFGSVDLNSMWIASALILAFVFLHGAYHVRRDEVLGNAQTENGAIVRDPSHS